VPVVEDSVGMGACMFKALVLSRHRLAMLPGGAGDANI
jgi:hypothetical protein